MRLKAEALQLQLGKVHLQVRMVCAGCTNASMGRAAQHTSDVHLPACHLLLVVITDKGPSKAAINSAAKYVNPCAQQQRQQQYRCAQQSPHTTPVRPQCWTHWWGAGTQWGWRGEGVG